MIKCWYCWKDRKIVVWVASVDSVAIEESFNFNLLASNVSRVFTCVRFFFARYKKQYGSQVKSAHGQFENNAASTPVLYSPWLYQANFGPNPTPARYLNLVSRDNVLANPESRRQKRSYPVPARYLNLREFYSKSCIPQTKNPIRWITICMDHLCDHQ